MKRGDPVLARLANANPAPADADLPSAVTDTVLLESIRERTWDMQTVTRPAQETKPAPPWWRRGPAVAVAAFVLVIGVGAVITLAAGGNDEPVATTPTTQATTTVATTTTTAPTTTSAPATTSAISTTSQAPTTTVAATTSHSVVIHHMLDGDVNGTFAIQPAGRTPLDGAICTEGTTVMLNLVLADSNSQQELWTTEFTCADGSGTFTGDFAGTYTLGTNMNVTYVGSWTIVEGTGAYEGILGSGSLGGRPYDFEYSGSIFLPAE